VIKTECSLTFEFDRGINGTHVLFWITGERHQIWHHINGPRIALRSRKAEKDRHIVRKRSGFYSDSAVCIKVASEELAGRTFVVGTRDAVYEVPTDILGKKTVGAGLSVLQLVFRGVVRGADTN